VNVSVIVPARRARDVLPACLDALAAQTHPRKRFEVIVVDTGEDGAEGLVREHGFEYLGDARRGPAVKRNAGAARARSSILAFTDPDCRPEPTWLEAGLEQMESGADLVQGPILPPAGQPVSHFGHHIHVEGPSPFYESANVFYRRPLFERLGGFPEHLHERLGEHFGEDTLLGVMARRDGARIAFSEDAVVRHEALGPDLGRHLREQWRLRHFPYLVGEAPELREALFLRLALDPGRSLVWPALAGLVARRRWLALPYAGGVATRLPAGDPVRALRNVPLYAVSDLVGAAALAVGSIRHRQLVL
jgi:glycosyltransferase involved in cell wall biosynthesis